MQVASRFTKSEAQIKAEQLSQNVAHHESRDDPLLQRAKEVLAENWEAPPSRDKVSEAMAILRVQRSARSSASKTSSIQTSLKAQSRKAKSPSEVAVSGIIANDEPNALHQTRSPLTLTSSTISGIGLSRGVLSPSHSHISIQHNESINSPVNGPTKPSRTNASASSHLSPTSTSTPISPSKKSFFTNIFASRADGNEFPPSSIIVPSSDSHFEDQRKIPNDVRDESETIRGDTPVFSNKTTSGANESPDDEHLVTEIDAYYGCQSSDNELPDKEAEVSSPAKASVARAVNFTGIERQEDPTPPAKITLLAPTLEAFFDKFFFPASGGSSNRFSLTTRVEESKLENKENDSHVERDVTTAPNKENDSHMERDVTTAPCGDEFDMTEIDAYYRLESLNSSDLKCDEQNPPYSLSGSDLKCDEQNPEISDPQADEGSSDGDKFVENRFIAVSEIDDYYDQGSIDSDSQSLELLKDMVFDRITQKDSYGKHEERMLNAEMHIALTITQNSSTISRGGPVTTKGSYDRSYSSEMSTEVAESMQRHDDPMIRSFSNRESTDEERSSPRNGSRNRSQSSGTSAEADGAVQLLDDPVIRSFSDREFSDEERSSPRNGVRTRTESSGTSSKFDDTVQFHEDPVIRSFSDRESSYEERSSPRNGSRTRSESSGTSTKVNDNVQLHDDPVIQSYSDRESRDGDRSSARNESRIQSESSGASIEVDDPVIRSFSDKGSSDEHRSSQRNASFIPSQSTGMSTEVDDIEQDQDSVIRSVRDRGSSDEDGQNPAKGSSVGSRSSDMLVAVEGTVELYDDIVEDESVDPVIRTFSDMESIAEDDNILSYLERIEASKLNDSGLECVEVVRMSPAVSVSGSSGELDACHVLSFVEPKKMLSAPKANGSSESTEDFVEKIVVLTGSIPLLPDADGVHKDAVDISPRRSSSPKEADAITDGAHKVHVDSTCDALRHTSFEDIDAIGELVHQTFVDDTPRHSSGSQANIIADGVQHFHLDNAEVASHDVSPQKMAAVDSEAFRGESCVEKSTSFRGIAPDAEQKAHIKESIISIAAEGLSRPADFPPSMLPLDSRSSSESDSLVNTERVQNDVACGAIAAASACFRSTKDVGCKVDQTLASTPDLSRFLPKSSDVNAMVGACAADSMCLSRTPKAKGNGNFRMAPIQLGSNSKMLANRRIFSKTPAADAMTSSRQAAFEEIGAMVMKILKDNDAISVTIPTDREALVEPESVAVPTDNLLDLDAFADSAPIAEDPFPQIDFGELTPDGATAADVQVVNSTDFWDLVKDSLEVPNDKALTIETTKLVNPPKVEDLLGGDLKVDVDSKKRATTTTGIPISIEIPEEDRQISAINSICSGAAEPNGNSTNTLQNQITAGLKEIFMNKVDTMASPRTNSKYDAYFEDVGKFVNSLLNGTSMYFDDSALRNVEEAIQNNVRDAMGDGT
jgi:hypothetical protein